MQTLCIDHRLDCDTASACNNGAALLALTFCLAGFCATPEAAAGARAQQPAAALAIGAAPQGGASHGVGEARTKPLAPGAKAGPQPSRAIEAAQTRAAPGLTRSPTQPAAAIKPTREPAGELERERWFEPRLFGEAGVERTTRYLVATGTWISAVSISEASAADDPTSQIRKELGQTEPWSAPPQPIDAGWQADGAAHAPLAGGFAAGERARQREDGPRAQQHRADRMTDHDRLLLRIRRSKPPSAPCRLPQAPDPRLAEAWTACKTGLIDLLQQISASLAAEMAAREQAISAIETTATEAGANTVITTVTGTTGRSQPGPEVEGTTEVRLEQALIVRLMHRPQPASVTDGPVAGPGKSGGAPQHD